MDQLLKRGIQNLRVLEDSKEVSIYKDKGAYPSKIYLSAIDSKSYT